MKKIIIAICIVVLLLNAGFLAYFRLYGSDELEEVDDEPDDIIIDDVITVDPEDFTVAVPELKIKDQLSYEYSIYAELYSENESAYEKYVLTADGSLKLNIPPTLSAEDGFKQSHECVQIQQITTATFNMRVEKSDSDTLTVHGTTTVSSSEYLDLDSGRTIKRVTNGDVYVDRLPRAPIPVSYTGKLRSYPNPEEFLRETLDETVFLKKQELEINMTGQYIDEKELWWMSQTYDWKADAVERVAGYNALRINISSKYFDWMDFNRLVWITNEVPQPVKAFVRTNASWDSREDPEVENPEWGHIILTTERELLNETEGGFVAGESAIPYTEKGADFNDRLPSGEFKSWDYMPDDGAKFDDTKMQMSPNAAITYAKNNHDGLQEFLDEYDNGNLVVNRARYNFTKSTKDLTDTEGKAGTYYWNITFSLSAPIEESWNVNQTFNVVVREVVEKAPLTGYESTFALMEGWERKSHRGSAPYYKSDLPSQMMTLSSAVEFLKQDEDVREKGFNARGGMDSDFRFNLEMAAWETDTAPGLNIVNTLTGISPPTAKYAWYLQQDTVWESGSTFSAAVDTSTGQMLFVMEVEGTTLNTLFT